MRMMPLSTNEKHHNLRYYYKGNTGLGRGELRKFHRCIEKTTNMAIFWRSKSIIFKIKLSKHCFHILTEVETKIKYQPCRKLLWNLLEIFLDLKTMLAVSKFFCCFYFLVISKHQCIGREREESNSHLKNNGT